MVSVGGYANRRVVVKNICIQSSDDKNSSAAEADVTTTARQEPSLRENTGPRLLERSRRQR